MKKVMDYWADGSVRLVKHPREELDLVCVADTCAVLRSVEVFMTKNPPSGIVPQIGCGSGTFVASMPPSPIGHLIAYLLIRLGWEGVTVRAFAQYFRLAGMLRPVAGGVGGRSTTGLTPETEAAAHSRTQDIRQLWGGQRRETSWDEWGFRLI